MALQLPIPFAVIEAPAGVNLDSLPTPGQGIAIWFKATNAQAAFEASSATVRS
jgi:hypothetical protein